MNMHNTPYKNRDDIPKLSLERLRTDILDMLSEGYKTGLLDEDESYSVDTFIQHCSYDVLVVLLIACKFADKQIGDTHVI